LGYGYFIDFIENENELLRPSILMVKFINRNLPVSSSCTVVPSQILYPPAPHIFVAHTTAVLQLQEPAFVRKDFMYKYVLNGSKYVLKCYPAFSLQPTVIALE
jgi:hypothetical protein